MRRADYLVSDLLADGHTNQAKLVTIAHILHSIEAYSKLHLAEYILTKEARYSTAQRVADATMEMYHLPAGINWTSVQEQISGIITTGLGGTRYPSVGQLNEIVKSISDMFKQMCSVDPATNEITIHEAPVGHVPASSRADVEGLGPGFEGGFFPVVKAPQTLDNTPANEPYRSSPYMYKDV